MPGVKIIPVQSLTQLFSIMNRSSTPVVLDSSEELLATETPDTSTDNLIEDVIGQELGKRAIEISAAGGHNVLLGGPPGTGKSMLAKTLPDLLPPMSRDEMLETTHLHSLASNDFNRIITKRPFRSPHHSASNIAIVGGGAYYSSGGDELKSPRRAAV